ncbi:glycosyltransferase family 2 protein [Vibrio crassostreae]|uniref:glycosyltransferase family 2 protein n=1 Tax=Vibrio crassostreae TaxID=246167 RepID=UPI000F4926F3|nr:glycosyltransferase family 2 protein [Vibrio crassostreae]ROS65581.1 glycosyltransferase involved in cell wall biosynthesis [Vibrio crassostreae]RPF12602.1 glycosyltransferase involved in cell wall biosynthesis [Vibrio crassostreae]TCT39783.1 glycosyltransferase involved in cell wall biosynthesis [Vibrio crassostreae]TCV60207.1 glycosyltransferase involved in cell wall biosynthesis [Vibrio crassostreae]
MPNGPVSVIIPFYSSTTGRLVNAVQSALVQTTPVEVIVVDDGSPISAESELESIQDKRLQIIRHKSNSNGAIARNTGIMHANHDLVAFLDYDDIWYQDKLEKQLGLFHLIVDKSGEMDKTVVYSRCLIVDGKRTLLRPTRAIDEGESVGDYLFCARQIIQTSGILLTTKMAKDVMFDDLKRHQDYQFCLSLESKGGKFFMCGEPTYEFIQVPKLNDYNFSLLWLEKYDDFLTKNAIQGFKSLVVLRSMITHKHYIDALKYSLKNGMLSSFFAINLLKLTKRIYITLRG